MSMRQFNLPPKLRSLNRESSGTIAASKCAVEALPPSLPRSCSSVCLRKGRASFTKSSGRISILCATRPDTRPGCRHCRCPSVVWERAYGRQDVGRALATRTDTPFNADGLTQTITAAMVLRCVEERRLSLDDSVGTFASTTEPDATIRQLLTHTPAPPSSLTFALRPERLAPLWPSRARMRGRLVPRNVCQPAPPARHVRFRSGSKHRQLASPAEGVPHPADVERYAAVLQRRATPYAVDGRARASAVFLSRGCVGTDTVDRPGDDGARSREVRSRVEAGNSAPARHARAGVERAEHERRAAAARHRLVRAEYNGEKVVWQFGMAENASSSLMITLPARGLTLILMANSDGLVKLYSPANGGRHAVAIREAVLEPVRPVMRARWLVLALWLLSPAPAAAEWQVRPFIGFTFGGATTFVDPEKAIGTQNAVIGVSGGWLGEIFGLEADFGRAPGFFQTDGRRRIQRLRACY